jgi:acetyltransferase
MIASANEDSYRETLKTILTDANVDAILVIIVHPPIDTTPEKIAKGIAEILSKKSAKPIFIVLMAETDESKGLSIFQQSNLPVYTFPESAAASIATMVKHQKWRKKPAGKIRKIRVDKASLAHIFEGAKADRRQFLQYEEITTLLKAYDFPLVEGKVIQSPQDAVDFYNHLKSPVALKIESQDIIHKSDSGCVRVDLKNAQNISKAFDNIMDNALKISRPEKISGILVQEMIQGSTEVVLGMNRDPNYGPLIMFGMGGIFVEVYQDICFRLAPLSENDAWDMIKETKAYQILKGFRGSEPVDFDVIVSSLLKLSQLSLDWPEISELDLNPFMVAPQQKNCKIVDARIKIQLKK